MSDSNHQFYPTPFAMAQKAWGMFKNKDVVRVLEPSAGRGDMLKAMPLRLQRRCDEIFDVCEIDFSKHADLRAIPGVSIVGMDFLQFGGGAIYSHIILNPPFGEGVKHLLKAWEILWDGEIVCILNAETIRNPYSRERQLLLALIDLHGEVEFIEDAFAGDDAERKTKVEIALVYLRKKSNVAESIVGTLLEDLTTENELAKAERLSNGYEEMQEVSIPSTVIENCVIAFDAAVSTMRASVIAEARATHYSNMVGATMAVRAAEGVNVTQDSSLNWVKTTLAGRYLMLKDQAWAGMLRSSQVTSKLSSKAQKRIESEFSLIKELEFSVSNIYGFMRGLIENQGQIQLDMACDIFDMITRYHTDNLCFYRGWKSNDNHRTCGMKIKTTRFVIPRNLSYAGSGNLSWESEKMLSDYDRVFAMLDGKTEPEVSLATTFRTKLKEMARGSRESSSYFDVRYYPGIGTIHFFPTNKELVEKLNKLVGEHRRWLPPADANVSETFWDQFKRAERFDKDLRAELDKSEAERRKQGLHTSRWDSPLHGIFDSERAIRCNTVVDQAMTNVHERHGIQVDFQLQAPKSVHPEQLFLLAA